MTSPQASRRHSGLPQQKNCSSCMTAEQSPSMDNTSISTEIAALFLKCQMLIFPPLLFSLHVMRKATVQDTPQQLQQCKVYYDLIGLSLSSTEPSSLGASYQSILPDSW